ncbi:hypothetical protein L198_06124 [Cryptococcus wingfieldii CBS 7118]|uniref:Uncharacterized protein n=1 Tax=Cryptococcus wingfieldii CBS 7118 TaxID=1295528 RepID=A0A1E3IQC1_9TREE|nr:hypothetical protein L198_06124 [Cryptococcus wingfieldii CBS 7118]ODN90807.1 hypothetical protein L198_06124 [Cryptococcus wingfieldii CBS 7118]
MTAESLAAQRQKDLQNSRNSHARIKRVAQDHKALNHKIADLESRISTVQTSLTMSEEEQIELFNAWAQAKAERGKEDSQLEFDKVLDGQTSNDN